MTEAIRNITIVGGGTAGWLAALILNRVAPDGVTITLIESPNIPTVGVGEATVPNMPATLQLLGISEQEFFKTCNASFKMGVVFGNWNVDAKGKPISYINPFTSPPNLQGLDWAGSLANTGRAAGTLCTKLFAGCGHGQSLQGPAHAGPSEKRQPHAICLPSGCGALCRDDARDRQDPRRCAYSG